MITNLQIISLSRNRTMLRYDYNGVPCEVIAPKVLGKREAEIWLADEDHEDNFVEPVLKHRSEDFEGMNPDYYD